MKLEEIRISCVNVNSINIFKFRALRENAKQSDIFCLIDTKHNSKSEKKYSFQNKLSFSSPSEQLNAKGILIFYNNDLTPSFNEIVKGQLVEMNFTLNSRRFKINVIYGPPDKDDPNFFLFNSTTQTT